MPNPTPQPADPDHLRRLADAAPVIRVLAAALEAEKRPKEESNG